MAVGIVFLLVCLAVKTTHADEDIQNVVSCPCGDTGENITICGDVNQEVCTKLSKCKICEEGSDVCTECLEGLEGPYCTEAVSKTCKNPEPISNGNIRFSLPTEIEGSEMKVLPVHTVMEYFCDAGYRLKGSQNLTCNTTGTWSDEVPTCVIDTSKHCKNPSAISNGNLRLSHPSANIGQGPQLFPVGTVAEYTCNEGYQLLRNKFLTCKSCPDCNPWWYSSHETPKCIKECGRGFFNYGPCSLLYCNRHAPWVVSISVKYHNVVTHVCLGTLLDHRTVLTAAHCLVGHSTFLIRFGKHGSRYRDDDLKVMALRSSKFLLHPLFSNTTFDSNIGLLFFEPKIRFTADVQPICMQDYSEIDRDIANSKTGIVSVTNGIDNAFSEGRMGLVRMTVLSSEACLEANKQAGLFITENSFCAGNKDDYQSVCDGDEGAPLFYYNRRENRFLLQGVVSFRTRGCSVRGNYAVFTRLDEFWNWISENLQ